MDPVQYLKSIQQHDAQLGLQSAYLSDETPEKAAERFQIAREFGVPPNAADAVTPEQKAQRQAALIDWAAMQVQAPVFARKLSDVNFANLVKDDITNASMLEKAIWWLAPETGEATTIWKALRNSGARGAFGLANTMPIVGAADRTMGLRAKLDRVRDLEKLIAEGHSDSELFGTEEDPTGALGRRLFDNIHVRQKKELEAQIEREAQTTAWAKRMTGLFAPSQNTQEAFKQKELSAVVAQVFQDPLMFLADIGPEAFTQLLPMIPLMTVGGLAGGAVGGMTATGLTSFGLDRASSLLNELEDLGVDTANPEAFAKWMIDPNNRDLIDKVQQSATAHAAGTALWDALSLGVAGRTLVPKGLNLSPARRNFANVWIQSPVQGAMGAAGEASGQYLAQGEVDSWADIVAEFAGEQVTAPVEVAIAGAKATSWAERRAQRAQKKAELFQQLAQITQANPIIARDPQTAENLMQEVGRQSGVDKILISAEALDQSGLGNRLREVSPSVNAQMDEALATGSDIAIPIEEYVTKVAPLDTEGALAQFAHTEGEPPVAELAQEQAATEQSMTDQAIASANATDNVFKRELADVGRQIANDIKAIASVTPEERQAVTALYQTFVGRIARDMGVSPTEVWNRYGARILGEPAIERNESGELVRVNNTLVEGQDAFDMGSPIWHGDLNSFVNNGKEFGRFVSENSIDGDLSAFLNSPRVEIQITRDSVRHVYKDHPDYLLEDFSRVNNILNDAVGGYVNGDRVVIFSKKPSGEYLAAVFKFSFSNRREREGGAKLRLELVTSYVTDGNTFRSQIKKKQAEHPGTGGELPSKPTFVGSLNQPAIADSLPQGQYFPNLRLIARWKNANRSTLLHESGHFFLEASLQAMVDLQAQAAELVGPMTRGQRRAIEIGEGILAWAGVKDFEAWQNLSVAERRKIHERFARSFEAYAMEGKAPAKGLKKAFASFKKFLKVVYGVLTAIPGQELNDDTRRMFDSLFATSSQLRESAMRQGLIQMATADELHLQGEDRVEYNQLREAFYEEAEHDQTLRNGRLSKSLHNLRERIYASLKKEAKGAAAQARQAVIDELKDTRTYKAWSLLKEGRKDGDIVFKPRLLWSELKQLGYNEQMIQRLYDAGFVTKMKSRKAMELPALAQELGYANSKELVDDMLANYNMDEKINDMAADRMLLERPELANEQAIRAATDSAFFTEARLRLLNKEVQSLSQLAKVQTRLELPLIEEIARETIAKLNIRELKPYRYMQAANRAARNARDAFRKGDLKGALRYKSQELYQSALAKAAKDAAHSIGKVSSFYKKYSKDKPPKAVEPGFSELIQRMLIAAKLTTLERAKLNPSDTSLRDLLQQLQDEHDVAVDISDAFLGALERGENVIATVGGFQTLYDAIRQLDFVGRRAQEIEIDGKRVALSDKVNEITQVIEANAEARGIEVKENYEGNDRGRFAKTQSFLKKIGFAHWRIPSLLYTMQGSRVGPFFDAVIAGLDRCGNLYESLKGDYTERIFKILDPFEKDLMSRERTYYKSIGATLTRMQVWAIALNMGNEGNLKRLLDLPETFGNGHRPVSQGELVALLSEALTSQELKAIQALWDCFEGLKKRNGQVHKRMHGREPLWVKNTPFSVVASDGETVELQGGYYPIVYDIEHGGTRGMDIEVDEAKSMRAMASSVFRGHLKTRSQSVKGNRAVALSMRGLFEGLENEIHFASWAEWVSDTHRLFRKLDPVIRKYWGPEAMRAINQWIADIANGTRQGYQGLGGQLLDLLRHGVALAGLGFNFMTGIIQLSGVAQSMAVVGAGWTRKGAQAWASNPKRLRQEVYAKSGMMRFRERTQFRELTEIQARINGNTGKIRDKMMRAAYLPIVFVQAQVDLITWEGAYQKALSEGNTDARAIALADRAVIDAQGSGRLQDLSGAERNGFLKLFTVFYSFFNTTLNNALVAGKTEDKLNASVDLFLLLIMQPVLDSLIRGTVEGIGSDDDDYWEKTLQKIPANIIGFNMGLLVGLRELQGVTGDWPQYTGPAATRKIADSYKGINAFLDSIKEGSVDEARLKKIVSAIGVWAGWPVTAINRAISGANALADDKTDNPAVLFLGYSDR